MADLVAIKGLGAVAEKVRDGANIGVLILKAAEADATLRDRVTVQALLAAAGNTEADFTSYVRKTIANASLTVTEDTANDRTDVDMPDQTWVAAGGATNNTTTKLVIYEDTGGSDATRVPLVILAFVATTDGNDLIAQINASGFFRATG